MIPAKIDRHKKFAQEWVIDQNGTRAAMAAGYAESGAHVEASRLLRNPKVRKMIDELQSKRASKLELKAERVLEELARIAFANTADYMRVNADGQPDVDLSKLTRDQAAAISEFSVDTTGGTGDGDRRVVLRTKVKLADKLKANELLCRHLGMFNDKLQITGLESLAERMNKLRRNGDADGDARSGD